MPRARLKESIGMTEMVLHNVRVLKVRKKWRKKTDCRRGFTTHVQYRGADPKGAMCSVYDLRNYNRVWACLSCVHTCFNSNMMLYFAFGNKRFLWFDSPLRPGELYTRAPSLVDAVNARTAQQTSMTVFLIQKRARRSQHYFRFWVNRRIYEFFAFMYFCTVCFTRWRCNNHPATLQKNGKLSRSTCHDLYEIIHNIVIQLIGFYYCFSFVNALYTYTI